MLEEPKYSGQLELTWTNKHRRLLAHEDGSYLWVDPSDYRVAEVRLLDDAGTIGKVAPDSERARDNLLIRGDALNALTSLAELPEFASEYVGKIKLAYLDPPFNTQQSFLQYDDALEHSVWLTMMRDRLRQIKDLLSSDGSVWVHLDDAEMHRCRVLMDEEFGAENFVGTIVWGKADTSRNDARQFSTDQDYLLVYSKTSGWRPNRLARSAAQDAIYSSPDGDPRPWLAKPGHAPDARNHVPMVYAIQSPLTGDLLYPPTGGCWRLGEARMFAGLNRWATYKRALLDDAEKRASICGLEPDEIRPVEAMVLDVPIEQARATAEEVQGGLLPEVFFTRNGNLLQVKGYKPEGVVPRTLWSFRAVGSNRNSKAEIKALFPNDPVFDTPKPERLMQRVLQIASDPGDIVLDCFAGSGTTAAVAHKMGRRWVIVERSRANVDTFIAPRLEKVVHGDDLGGITTTTTREPTEPLPEGVTPEDARAFTTLLNKFEKLLLDGPNEGKERREAINVVVKQLRAAAKTKEITRANWEGGGGFRILDVAPSMFEDTEGTVIVADWASDGKLAEATAAQLGFVYEPGSPFVGCKGRSRLAVVDGLVNPDVARLLVDALATDELLTLCGTAVDPATPAALRAMRRGSVVRKIPASILAEYRRPRWLATAPQSPSKSAS